MPRVRSSDLDRDPKEEHPSRQVHRLLVLSYGLPERRRGHRASPNGFTSEPKGIARPRFATTRREGLTSCICCSTLCCMTRRSVSFQDGEVDSLLRFLEEGSEEQLALTMLTQAEAPKSESSLIRALVLIGQSVIEERAREARYNAAMDHGEYDAEASAWATASSKTSAAVWASD